MEHNSIKSESISWLSFLVTTRVPKRCRNQVEALVKEHKHTDVHQNAHDSNLVKGLNENIPPHERKHDLVFSADSVGFIGN